MKPTNSPTQGPTEPKKTEVRSGIWAIFPTANSFSWVGIDFVIGNRQRETQPNQNLCKHPSINVQTFTIFRFRIVIYDLTQSRPND